MSIGPYIKIIGRGARGAKGLERAQAADLLGQVLDGQASDLEVGAFLHFKAGISFGAGGDSKVYFLINDWNDVFCAAPDGVGLAVFGRL